jgi:hypothetical protein
MGLSKQGQQAVNKVRQVEKEARIDQIATSGLNGDALAVPLLLGESS